MWRRRGPSEDEFRQEIEAHIALETERLTGEGLKPEEAARAARRTFGNRARARERFHESRRLVWIAGLGRDIRHAGRAVRTRPAASIAIASVLTVGIGFMSAVFAMADPFLLRPLPYANPDALVSLGVSTRDPNNLPTTADWQARRDLFVGLATSDSPSMVLVEVESGVTVDFMTMPVSASYFGVLGLRVMPPDDWRAVDEAAETPVFLTASAASRLFGSDNPIGRFIPRAGGEDGGFRVVGVLPSNFIDPFARVGRQIDGLVPLGDTPLVAVERSPGGGVRTSYLNVIARLRTGVEPGQVEAALTTGAPVERAADEATVGVGGGGGPGIRSPEKGVLVTAEPLAWRLFERTWPIALGALAAGILIMVVCAANVANLLLARGAARLHEFAAREALGASRWDVVRLVLVELALLTATGVIAGLLLAGAGLAGASFVIPEEYTLLGDPSVTGRVVVLASLCGAAVMLAGVVPAWAAWRVRPRALLGRIAGRETRGVRALRFGLMVAQTVVAVVLLIGAALLARSYINLLSQDPGYDEGVVAIRVQYPEAMKGAPTSSAIDATLARLRTLPRIEVVASNSGPLVDGFSSMSVGRPMTIGGADLPRMTPPRQVTPEFFEVVGARVVAGRLPVGAEWSDSAVVSETLARRCCESPDAAIGQVLTDIMGRPFTVRAVVGDMFTSALDEPPGPVAYFPEEQPSNWPSFVLRVQQPTAALLIAVEREVRAAAPLGVVGKAATMGTRLMDSARDRSFATLVLVFFATSAVAVSVAGIAGVVGFVVARRTRELAIRMAIGARPAQVRRLVTREALTAALLGAAVGLATGGWLSRILESLLYGLEPADPSSLVIAAVLAVASAVAAGWWPARRATRLAPSTALREE